MNSYTTYGNHPIEYTSYPPTSTVVAMKMKNESLLLLIIISIPALVVICLCFAYCYSRGFKEGQKSIQMNEQQEQPAQYQGQNTSNEISHEDHAYEKPRPPSNETSQNHELELSAYEEVKENQIEEYQEIDKGGFYVSAVSEKMLISLLLTVILIVILVITIVSTCCCFCCYKRGFKQGQKSIPKDGQQEEQAQYQGVNTSNEISDQEHAYEKPRQPTNETSQNHDLELSAYEEVQENQTEEYQKIGEDVYLIPVIQQHPLPSVGAGN